MSVLRGDNKRESIARSCREDQRDGQLRPAKSRSSVRVRWTPKGKMLAAARARVTLVAIFRAISLIRVNSMPLKSFTAAYIAESRYYVRIATVARA